MCNCDFAATLLDTPLITSVTYRPGRCTIVVLSRHEVSDPGEVIERE